jgi:hypothetical protein
MSRYCSPACREVLFKTPLQPYEVKGDNLEVKRQQAVSFMLEGREYQHPFLVCNLPTDAASLVGTDFMASVGAKLDFHDCKLLFSR